MSYIFIKYFDNILILIVLLLNPAFGTNHFLFKAISVIY